MNDIYIYICKIHVSILIFKNVCLHYDYMCYRMLSVS